MTALEANADNGVGAGVSSGTEPEHCSLTVCSKSEICRKRHGQALALLSHRGDASCFPSSTFHTLEKALPSSSPFSSPGDGPLNYLGVRKIISCGKCPSGLLLFQWMTRTAKRAGD